MGFESDGEMALPEAQRSSGTRTIEVDEDTFAAICRLRSSGESDAEIVRHGTELLEAMEWISRMKGASELRINFQEFRRAGVIAQQLSGAGYREHTVVTLCHALLGDWSDNAVYEAFQHLAQERDSIPALELRKAVPLMGEGIFEDKADEMMCHADADSDGQVYFHGFSSLIEKIRDHADHKDDEVLGVLSPTLPHGDVGEVGDLLGSWAFGASSLFSAVGTAWTADLPGLSLAESRKAGLVMNQMQEAGYSEEMATSLCRAIFCEQSDSQIQEAFKFYDLDDVGLIDLEEFRAALPLMGESISPEEVDKLLDEARDPSEGKLDVHDFAAIIRRLNPKEVAEYSVSEKLDEVLTRITGWF